ncbi:PaaI family thioesterase [Pseudonocardia sp. NPDC049154]|uniref:PaaI family thioesterase n=1 Tax=Pseudonocardia sp. NPDC049154 TaxID=3155501 RepID=UPI00340C66A5
MDASTAQGGLTGLAQVSSGAPHCTPELATAIELVEARHGEVRFRQTVPPGLGPTDQPPPALLGMLVDTALGRSALTTAPAGGGCRTASLRIDLLDAWLYGGESLVGSATVVGSRGLLVHALGDVRGRDGRTVALASGWFAILDDDPDPDTGGGHLVDTPAADPRTLHDLVRARVATDVRPEVGTDVLLDLCSLPGTANRKGTMHGGMQVAMAETALHELVRAHDPRAHLLASVDVTMHRPIPVGAPLTGHGRVVRAGRRIVTAEFEVRGPAERLLLSCHGTLTPDVVP